MMTGFLSKLPTDWSVVPFGDLMAESAFGPRFSGEFYATDGNVATLRTTDIADDGWISYETMPSAQLDLNKFEQHFLKKDDLVITRSGTCGIASIFRGYPKPVLPGAFLIRIRLDKKNDVRYYRNLFNSSIGRAHVLSIAAGAVQQNINLTNLKKLKVPAPPLPIQRKIAAILSAYDDLIENNRRRIKILEEMAQSLYREWFIKFRFPGHEHARFTDSVLGRIPEGWEVTEFRNIFDIKYGKTLPKTEIAEIGPYPVYGAGDVIGYYDKVLCQEKCALVTSRGNGSGTVWRTREAAFVTNNSLIIQPKVKLKHWNYSFVELLLNHSNVMEAKTGSAQPQVTIENLNYVKAIVPERSCVEKFCSFVTPISEQVDLYLLKNTTLRRTRDLLLPRLISGEVDVSELDITVPEEAIA